MVDLSRRGIFTGRWRQAVQGIRPPWSASEPQFLAHCLRCDACVNACETQVLTRGDGGYPTINFSQGECSFCYACAEACPESLFLPRHTRAWELTIAIGKGCLSFHHVECRQCQDACEPEAITFHPASSGIYQPRLASEACTGCGACAAGCPASAITAEYTHVH